jgi:hypothetical protein
MTLPRNPRRTEAILLLVHSNAASDLRYEDILLMVSFNAEMVTMMAR